MTALYLFSYKKGLRGLKTENTQITITLEEDQDQDAVQLSGVNVKSMSSTGNIHAHYCPLPDESGFKVMTISIPFPMLLRDEMKQRGMDAACCSYQRDVVCAYGAWSRRES